MKIGEEVGRLTKMINEEQYDTPDTSEADVGRENTHYQNRKVDPETWEGGLVRWVSRAGR